VFPYLGKGGLTVCVTGAGAGVDSAWEQRKLEARKMLENGDESPVSSARCVSPLLTFKIRKEATANFSFDIPHILSRILKQAFLLLRQFDMNTPAKK
jgi:hypothetical protein